MTGVGGVGRLFPRTDRNRTERFSLSLRHVRVRRPLRCVAARGWADVFGGSMSHSTVLVLLPSRPDDIEEAATKALAPFDENMEVPEYMEPCFCVGGAARNHAQAAATAAHGTMESLRQSFRSHTIELRESGADVDAAWQAHIASWLDVRAAAEAAHPMAGKPDPDCEECGGSGQSATTRNPKSRWDWWAIGGRWDGLIPDNACAVRDIPAEVRTFAVLDVGGVWHERGRMGWFAMVSDEKDDWAATCAAILAANADAFAVLVDVHI